MNSRKKRGISGLLSVVLLVSFVIVLGIIVTNWSGKLVKKNIEKGITKTGTDIDCLNLNIKVSKGTGDVIFVRNENQKPVIIKGFISRLEESNKVVVDYKYGSSCIDKEIEAFGAHKLDYSLVAKERDCTTDVIGYNPANLKSIEVIPQIALENGEVVDCVKKSVEYALP
jgi:hypothetical protein